MENNELEELKKRNEELFELCQNLEHEHSTIFKDWCKEIAIYKKEHEKYDKAMSIIEKMIKDLKELFNE